MAPKPKFTPFPEPRQPDDLPLVTPHGFLYRCSGCGATDIPAGVWITETIDDGMVTGMSMRRGDDGPVVHACGSAA